MKLILTFAVFLAIIGNSFAQAPQGIPYQAVARNSSGALLSSTIVSIRFTVRDGLATGVIKYRETHTITTSSQGLFSVNLGEGTPTSGTFSSINWSVNDKFLQVEMDPAGGSSYVDMGTQKLMSVPYALQSNFSNCISPTVSGTGDTVNFGCGKFLILPGASAANCNVTAGTITGSTTVCTGSTTALSSSSTGGVWSSSTSGIASVNSSGVVTGVGVGTTTISYIVTESCGSDTVTTMVNVMTLPATDTITGTLTVCAGATTTLSNATTGGTWSSGATAIATVNSSGVVSGVAAGTAIISYTVTNSCGSTSVTKIVTVNPLPVAGTITGSSTISGCGTTLSNSTSGGVWSSSNTATVTISSGGVAVGVSTGSAVITYTVTNLCGSANATLSVSTNITVAIGQCYAGGKVAYIYLPGDPGYVAGQVNGIIVAPSDIGAAAWGCAGTNVPGATSYALGSGAANTAAILAACTTPGIAARMCDDVVLNGYSDWHLPSRHELDKVWASRAAHGAMAGATSPFWASTQYDANTAFRMAINDGSYFNGNKSNTVPRVLPVRYFGCTLTTVSSLSGTASLCTGATTTLSTTSTGGTWSSGATGVATVSSAGLVTAVAAGTATISYTITESCGSASATLVITVNPILSAGTITGSDTVISGSTITLSNATTGGTWSSSNTGIATVGSTGIVTAVSVGIATISYTVTNSCGSNVATKAVTVPMSIGASFGGGVVAHIYLPGEDCYVSGEIHGLIAAPYDQSGGIRWWSGFPQFVSTTSVNLCTGNANTNNIVGWLGGDSYAAKLCADLVLNGYSDWYLPSRNEMLKLADNRTAIGGFAEWYYWTSSDANDHYATYVGLVGGVSFGIDGKNNSNKVRAVRSF